MLKSSAIYQKKCIKKSGDIFLTVFQGIKCKKLITSLISG